MNITNDATAPPVFIYLLVVQKYTWKDYKKNYKLQTYDTHK